jgi:hypothetical protein
MVLLFERRIAGEFEPRMNTDKHGCGNLKGASGGSGGGEKGVLFFDWDLVGFGGTALEASVLQAWFWHGKTVWM